MTISGEDKRPALWRLDWDQEEGSHLCEAQAIIVDSKRIWLSCTTYLLKGDLLDGDDGVPQSIRIRTSNADALSGPRKNHAGYGHIGDGSLVTFDNGTEELWFGLEDGNWPRQLNAAIVRYDAESLNFRGVHVHPSLLFMPWLAGDSLRRKAYTPTWENVTELQTFDMERMEWTDRPIALSELQPPFQNGISYIQGAQVNGNDLLLISDNYKGSLVTVDLRQPSLGRITNVWNLGLGNEREGIAVSDGYLFSLGNRWRTWENTTFAEVLCLPQGKTIMDGENTKSIANTFIAARFVVGLLVGIVVGYSCSAIATHTKQGAAPRQIETEEGYDVTYRDTPDDDQSEIAAETEMT